MPAPPDADSLFLQAVERDDPADRAALLDERCGDDAGLRAEVEALLAAHDDAGSFLKRPAEPTHPGLDRTVMSSDLPPVTHPAGTDSTGPNAGPGAASTVGGSAEATPASPSKLGAYDVSGVIGRGGMGVVLKARDPHLDRTVAIKTLAPELAADPTARRRFAREARAAAAVTHPHVVTIHAVEPGESGPGGPVPFLVMEYVAGRSLRQKLDADGAMGVTEILRIGAQIADGLAAAHKQGLIHRDVKPGNVLLENGVERVKLTDFGLARAADDVAITRTGDIAGTPQFMSPEQAEGKPVDHRSDLFSLGAVLYAMCTGRPPFRGESAVTVLRKVCDQAPRPIREVNPDVPPWLTEIVDRLLAKNPDDRFASAAAVAAVLSERLAEVQNPDFAERPTRALAPAKPRRVKGWAIAAAALAAALLIGGASEAAGVTEVIPTVVRLVRGDGTLVVRTDDPNVGVTIEGEDVVLTGTGLSEIRLKPGRYQVKATKDGREFTELVTVERNGREVVNVGWEADGTPAEPAPINAAAGEAGGAPAEPAPTDARDAAWVTIFDGRSLDGWRAEPPAVWSVEPGGADESGTLTATLPPGVRLAELRWVDADGSEGLLPADFELSFTFAASPGAHLKVRTRDRDGSLFAEFPDPPASEWWGMLTSRVPSREQVYYRLNGARPPGLAQSAAAAAGGVDGRDWHRVRLRVEGRTASMAINGVELGGGTDPDLFAGPEGLRFEVYRTSSRAGDATVRLRDVRYRPLNADAPPAAEPPKTDPAASPDEGAEPRPVPLVRTFEGHEGPVKDVAFSPDGTLAASGSGWPVGDDTARIWDAATGRLLRTLRADAGVMAVAFSPDGRRLLTGDQEGAAVLWDVETGDRVRAFDAAAPLLEDVAFTPDGRFAVGSTGHGGRLIVWDAATGEATAEVPLGADAYGVTATPDGRHAAVAVKDGTVRLIDVNAGEEVRRFAGWDDGETPSGFWGVAVSPDGATLAGGGPHRIRLWDLAAGTPLRDLPGPGGSLAFSPGGRRLTAVSKGFGSFLRAFDVATGEPIAAGPMIDGHGWAGALAPDGRAVLTGGGVRYDDDGWAGTGDYALRLWRLPEPNPAGTTAADHPFTLVRRLEGHASAVHAIAVYDGGRKAVSGSAEKRIGVWDVETGSLLKTIETGAAVKSVAVTPDGPFAVVGTVKPAELRWYDLNSGELVRRAGDSDNAAGGFVSALALTPDGTRVIAGRNRGGVEVYDAADATLLRTLAPPRDDDEAGTACLAVSPDGARVAAGWHSGGTSGVFSVWTLDDGERLLNRRLFLDERSVRAIAFSPDGAAVLVGDSRGRLMLCDAADGTLRQQLSGHDDRSVDSVAFLPDGRRALSAGLDGTVRLWDTETAEELARLERPDQVLLNVTLLPGGERFLTGGGGFWDGEAIEKTGDYALRLWELAEDEPGDAAPVAIRRSLDRLADEAADGLDAQELKRWTAGSPELAALDTADARRLLELLGTLPAASRERLLRDGYLKWRFNELDAERRETLTDVYAAHLARSATDAAGATDDLDSGGAGIPFGGFAVKWLTREAVSRGGTLADNDVGFALVDPGGDAGSTLDWFVLPRSLPTPMSIRLLGAPGGGASGRRSSRNTQLLFLNDRPRSPPPAVAPPEPPAEPDAAEPDAAAPPPALIEDVRLDGLTDFVLALAYTPDGTRLITAGGDGVIVWDARNGRRKQEIAGHDRSVHAVVVLPDGKRVVAGGKGDAILLSDLATGGVIRRFEGHTGFVECLAVSPDGKRIASGSSNWVRKERGDLTVRVWDAETGEELWRADPPPTDNGFGSVRQILFTADGSRVLSMHVAGEDGISLWDAATGELLRRFSGQHSSIKSAALSPDGRTLATGHDAVWVKELRWDDPQNAVVRLWDLESGEELRRLVGHAGGVQSVAFSADGARLLTCSGGQFLSDAFVPDPARDNSVRLWDVATGRELARQTLPKQGQVAALSPDGRQIASAAGVYQEEPAVQLWRVPEGVATADASLPGLPVEAKRPAVALKPAPLAEVRRFRGGHVGRVNAVALSNDGTRLASASADGTARLWDVATGRELRALLGHRGEVKAVAFSPDGGRVLTGANDGVRLWDAGRGELLARPYVAEPGFELEPGDSRWVSAVAFGPKGPTGGDAAAAWVNYAQQDRLRVALFGAADGDAPRTLDPLPAKHGDRFGNASALAFTPDGERLFAAGEWRLIGEWDAATGRFLRKFRGTPTHPIAMALSADGARMVTGHADGDALLWDVKTGQIARRLGAGENGHAGPVNAVAISPDGAVVATGSGGRYDSGGYTPSEDNAVRLWDAGSGAELARVDLPVRVTSVAFAPDGGSLVTGGGEPGDAGADLRLWRTGAPSR